MITAKLGDGRFIDAKEYNSSIHGERIYCIDPKCKASLIFVSRTERTIAHFKTSGKYESRHTEECGFFQPLDFVESLEKVKQYQETFQQDSFAKTIINLNLNKIDPDYESRQSNREESEKKKKDPAEIKIKQDNDPPKTINSLNSVVKLMTAYEPDVLAKILVTVKGNRIPLSDLILSYDQAHTLLWSDRIIDRLQYFIFGTIETVIRREKVYYINFKNLQNDRFSLVVFDKYFKFFTFSDEELINKNVLVVGALRKNTFKDINTTEMIIKSDKYLAFLPKNIN